MTFDEAAKHIAKQLATTLEYEFRTSLPYAKTTAEAMSRVTGELWVVIERPERGQYWIGLEGEAKMIAQQLDKADATAKPTG